jgi:hypothetical protein
MSNPTTTTPISPARFQSALSDLPVSSLHAKAAELRNSIFHLRNSNIQLQPFADQGDRDCAEAIAENEDVLGTFRERVEMLRWEVVDNRHMPWVEWDEEKEVLGKEEVKVNGEITHVSEDATVANGASENGMAPAETSGSLSDEELRRRMAEQVGDEDEDEGGLHL